MPPNEVHFFDKAHNHIKGAPWYEAHFEAAKTKHIVGEKTPDYLWTTSDGAEHHIAHTHQRIHALYPNTKLIVTLRNPVERAVSALNHLIRTGRISPFRDADELLTGPARPVKRHGVLQKGFYFNQIQAYLELFDRDQFLFLIFEEDIIDKPARALEQIRSFLGIPSNFPPDDATLRSRINAHHLSSFGLLLRYYTPLPKMVIRRLDFPFPAHKIAPSTEVVRRLYDMYAEANSNLFSFLGRRPQSWLKSTYLQKG